MDIDTKHNPLVVTEVTGLYPTLVDAVFVPGQVAQLQEFMQQTNSPISIGGGRFSMGGQIAATDTVHIDMRGLNRILDFDVEERVLRVESGIRWRDIQRHIDEHGLAVKIMQTYSDFTVSGSISVNCHGRYIGLGPLVLSIRSLRVMLHDGGIMEASPTVEPELFYSVVGGYGAIGIIVEVELDLTSNTRVERVRQKMSITEYHAYFKDQVRNNPAAVFHNADLYPPDYESASAVTWYETDKPATVVDRLNPGRRLYLLEIYLLWAITEMPFGKWRREHLIDPLIYRKQVVHWRNYEAGYHVEELEPLLRDRRTYVLQEYFVPVDQFLTFTRTMTEILSRHRVNVVNISVRHAHQDPGTYLAWARQESFAFVLYYKQRTRSNARERVAVWTRELIDAAIAHGGAYYLPYQPVATTEQFRLAYPNVEQLFAVKRLLDPNYRFRNSLWNRYFEPESSSEASHQAPPGASTQSEFLRIYQDTVWRDHFYRFLQNIYRIFPEDRFHALIMEACEQCQEDEAIYQLIQSRLPDIKPALRDIRYSLPALLKQKKVIADQTTRLIAKRVLQGYLEIGSTGRYVRPLQKSLNITGPVYLCNEVAPDNSPAEIMERGSLRPVGTFFTLDDYNPIGEHQVMTESLDLVTCFIGLHHCELMRLDAYVASIHRVLRKGGVFVLRDHDAGDETMKTFVSLVHTVFNVGLDVSWQENQQEKRFFNGLEHWIDVMTRNGFSFNGDKLLQAHDPSANTLMAFVKI